MQISGDVVQNVGDIDIMFAHNKLYNGLKWGGTMHLGGFKLQGEFLSMSQMVENSVLVPTLGGGSVQLTNNNNCGQITFSSIRTGYLDKTNQPQCLNQDGMPVYDASGYFDIVSISDALRAIEGGDGTGGTFQIDCSFNGSVFSLLLRRCTLVRSPPFIASGTDAPNYQSIFNYSRPVVLPSSTSASDISNDLAEAADLLLAE
jgi:hypothetical protein